MPCYSISDAGPVKSAGPHRENSYVIIVTSTAITTFLRARPAESANLSLLHLLVLCQVRDLRGMCSCSHFTDEEMESPGLVQGLPLFHV